MYPINSGSSSNRAPTVVPIRSPTVVPIRSPTVVPIRSPTVVPIRSPTVVPIRSPTVVPIRSPTVPAPRIYTPVVPAPRIYTPVVPAPRIYTPVVPAPMRPPAVPAARSIDSIVTSPTVISLPRINTTVIPQLDIDVLVQIVIDMTPKQIANLCISSPQFASLCRLDEFYEELIKRKFGVTINAVPGKTLRDKFNYLSQFDFDWRNIPGSDQNQKLKFIIDTLEKSETNKTVFMSNGIARFDTRNGSSLIVGVNVTKDDITESILINALKIDDINFFMIVLSNIFSANPILRTRGTEEYTLFSIILYRTVIESIKTKRYNVASWLLDYLARSNFDGLISLFLSDVLKETFTSDEDRKFLEKYVDMY